MEMSKAMAEVAASYAATHQRLADDPEYQRLRDAAKREAIEEPGAFIARNRFAFHIEVETPLRLRSKAERI
jgi:hypothetical protein